MKKVFAILLSIVFILSMSTVAFATDGGTITITNAENEAEYKIYQMLDFAPSKTDATKGIYTILAGWEDFFTAEPATNTLAPASITVAILSSPIPPSTSIHKSFN